jgi:hypothetical protein
MFHLSANCSIGVQSTAITHERKIFLYIPIYPALREVGYTDAEIDALAAAGAVREG